MEGSISGIGQSIKNNPDVYLNIAASMAPRGWRAPLAAMGGAAEQYMYGNRMGGSPTTLPHDPGGLDEFNSVPKTVASTPKYPPRSREQALLASSQLTSQYAKEDREAAAKEEAALKSMLSAPISTPRPGAVTQPQSGSVLGRGAVSQPSLEKIARLLVMRGKFGPDQSLFSGERGA